MVIPILLVVGISNNVLVITGFSQRSVRSNVHPRLSVFYRLIAAFDIWVLISKDFMYFWLEDGLGITTGGALTFVTRTSSDLAYFSFVHISFCAYIMATMRYCLLHPSFVRRCKLYDGLWLVAIVCCDYTLASMSVERALVVCLPLQVRR